MNIEPLNLLFELYDNDKIGELLYEYLPSETIKLINNYNYVTDNSYLFLNDKIILISKNTGKFYKQGYIIKINSNLITIKTNLGNITENIDKYYIFCKIKINKSNKTKQKYYEELLKIL
jgi:hypothetical protein